MLRIIADDFGLIKSVNDGIVFLLKEGKISGASLMANGEAFEDAIAQLSGIQTANVGAHLVLVEEKSLSGMNLPKNHRTFFVRYILGLIKLSDIEKELRAQIKKITNAGVKINFVNSHQHLHLLPGIMGIVIKLAKEYQVPHIRLVNEVVFIPRSYYKYDILFSKFFRILQLFFLRFLSRLAKKQIQKAGLQCNDFFVGFVNAGSLSESDIKYAKNLAEKYPDKIIELGCHPGYEGEELKRKYKHWGNYNWE